MILILKWLIVLASSLTKALYNVRDALCAMKAPSVQQLRDKYTYNVCPCPPEEEEEGERGGASKICPPPTRGGAFGAQDKSHHLPSRSHGDAKDPDSGDWEGHLKDRPLPEQVKVLQRRYRKVTRTPMSVSYGLDVTPMARASCPQSKKQNMSAGYSAYAADVPQGMLQSFGTTPILDGLGTRAFTLMYSQPVVVKLPLLISDKTSKQIPVFHHQ